MILTPGSGRRRTDRGSATAELALALPTLVVVLAVGFYALAAASLQGRCATAAAAGARSAARGDDVSVVRQHALAGLPSGSSAELGRADLNGEEPSLVTVRVTAVLPMPAGLHGLAHAHPLTASAGAADEALASGP